MRTLLLGLLTGLCASLLRAPLGIDLVHLSSTPASISVAYRAAAFFLLALALLAGRNKAGEGLSPLRFLAGTAIGLTSHGLLLASTPSGHLLATLVCALLGAALYYTARGVLGPELEDELSDADDEDAPQIPTATPLAHAIIGAGLALCLEGLFRHLRLFSTGLPSDDSVFGIVLTLLILVGAGCFKNLVRSTTSRTLCLAGGSLGALLSLRLITGISTGPGLDRYLKWFDLDTSLRGTLGYDALLAALVFIIPAFLIGAGFQGVLRRSNLAGLSIGAAIGLLISPHCLSYLILEKVPGEPFLAHHIPASHLITWGAAVAFAGAGLHLIRHPGIARWAALSFFIVSPLPFIAPPDAIRILAPWQPRTPQPQLIFDTPEGLLTIEETAFGLDSVTLDRRLISPQGTQAASDRLQLIASVALLPKEMREGDGFKVLLIGQLTPGRALTLSSLGADSIDRTASWHRAMGVLESHLFQGHAIPKGEHISPATARSKMGNGSYDLVIAPSIRGEQPTTRNLASGPDTVSVVWFDTAGGASHLSLGAGVILSTATLEDLSIGVLHGVDTEDLKSDELLFSAGAPIRRETPLSSLGRRVWDREQNAQALMAERLAAAENGGVEALIAAGLGAHYAVQEHSSPYETLAQRIELTEETLGSWSTAALASPLARPTRELVGATARALRGKRDVTQIYEHLEPISEAHPTWVQLVEILSYADLEALDPSQCIHRIESILALGVEAPALLIYLSDALVQLGRASDAVEHLWHAYSDLPNNQDVKERLAIALVRAGDKEGKAMIEDLLLEDPDREHLRPYLMNGPLPSASTGFTPFQLQAGPLQPADEHEGHNH